MERADFGEWRRERGFCRGSCHLVEGSSRGGQVRTKGVALRKREERGSAVGPDSGVERGATEKDWTGGGGGKPRRRG